MMTPKPGEVYWVALGLMSVEHHRLSRKAGRFDPEVIRKVRNAIAWMLELPNI